MADTWHELEANFQTKGYSIGTRYAPLGNWKPLLENETSLPTSWSAAIIHVRLFFHCVRVWLQIFWRATLLKMSFSHSLVSLFFFPFFFFFYYYYSFFRVFPSIFLSSFFSLFCFRQFFWFSSLFSFFFPFFFPFFLFFFLSIYPPDNGQFSVPRRYWFANGRSVEYLFSPVVRGNVWIFPSAASSACLVSFLILFLFFFFAIPHRSFLEIENYLLKFGIENEDRARIFFFKIFHKEKKKNHERSWSFEERSRGFIYFFFVFFLSFSINLEIFFKFAKIVARTRANVNEDRRDPRNTLPFSQQPHRIRDCLSDNYYYYYGCVSLTSFLHVYLSIFFFFLSRFSYYFFFLTRLDNSRV